jgi:cytochrome c oxidase cbb3-type subunit III
MGKLMRRAVLLGTILAVLWPGIAPAQHEAREAGKKKRHSAIGNAEAITAGQKLYAGSCAGCHGPSGQGGRGPNLVQRGAWHPLGDEGLYQTIEKGVAGADMPPTKLPEAQLWQLVAFVRSLTVPAAESPLPGDPQAGESLFWGQAGCGNCHSVRGRGGHLGPDLSDIGATRPLERIRESVLDPDADGWAGYEPVRLVLRNGRRIEGVARNRTNYSIQVQDSRGGLHLLAMNEVEKLQRGKRSPMPDDYRKRLSRKEVNDVLAYLSRQTMRPYLAGEPAAEDR